MVSLRRTRSRTGPLAKSLLTEIFFLRRGRRRGYIHTSSEAKLPHWEDSIEKRFFETHIDDVYRKRAIHLYRRGTGFLPVYTRLKKGGVLGTVVDVPAETGSSESATTIPFLGGRVSFCNEFARFALKTRALLIPVFLRIKHPAHYEMSIYQPLDTEAWASKQGPVEACMRQCFALIESKIREDPAQWWLWKDLDHFWHGHA